MSVPSYSLEQALDAYRLGLFFSKVAIPTKGQNRCWEWTGSICPKGYGMFSGSNGRCIRAHRFSAIAFNGPPPVQTMHACHRCDNPGCVNPKHLFWGSALENVADCKAKGRRANLRGHDHGRAVLTEEIVRSIRQRRANGEKQRDIALDLGVSQYAVWSANAGKTWAHVA